LDRHLTCAQQSQRFTDRRRTLASLLPEDEALPDEHRLNLAATWSLSIEAADRLAPAGLARPLLQIASVLDPNGMPLSVFTAPAVLTYLAVVLEREVNAEQARDGLACLHRLNLVVLDPSAPHVGVRVHSLVQRTTRERLALQDLAMLTRAAADGLLHAWPAVERDIVVAQALRANTIALYETVGAYLWRPETHAILTRVSNSLGLAHQFTAALRYMEHLCASASEYLGADHLDTLVFRDHFAHWRGMAGDAAGAFVCIRGTAGRPGAGVGLWPPATAQHPQQHDLVARRGW
jgi:hypothetical protein